MCVHIFHDPFPHFFGLVGSAITVYGTGSGVTIQGNTIGLDAAGAPVLGSVTGIASYNYYLGPVQSVTVGGQGPGEGNEIAGHLGSGIVVVNPFVGVAISGNSIHDNGGIGIDLVTPVFQYGVTPNDALDADAGGNGLQNFPVLTGVRLEGASTRVLGRIDSEADSNYFIDFYSVARCDPSGHGGSSHYLGDVTISTPASGSALFQAEFLEAPTTGYAVATATRTLGGPTSEFSRCIAIGDLLFADGFDPVE